MFGGADPGLDGGFAVISGDKICYKLAMPTLSFTTNTGKIKTEIDRLGVLSFLKKLPPHTHVAIEEVQAFRKQNITSTCTTCKNYGILLMALTVANLYTIEVPPGKWQTHFGIVSVKQSGGESTKQQAFRIARKLYPDADFRKSERSHIAHDGIVDATLLANYGQALFAPTPQIVVPLVTKLPDLVEVLECKPGGNAPGTKKERRML